MRRIKRLFREHPASVGESYTEHMAVAAGFSGRLFVASLACAVHALLPFLCTRTGSKAIENLHRDMVSHRVRAAGGRTPVPEIARQPER